MTSTEKRVIVLQCVCDIITTPKNNDTEKENALKEARELLETSYINLAKNKQQKSNNVFNADIQTFIAYGFTSFHLTENAPNIDYVYNAVSIHIENALTLLID
jgi:hypothetical protein